MTLVAGPALAQDGQQRFVKLEPGARLSLELTPDLLAQAEPTPSAGPAQPFDIPAQDLQSALLAFSREVDLQLLYSSALTAGMRTNGVRGTYTPEAALAQLLSGTGLSFRFTDATTVTIEDPGTKNQSGQLQLGPIIVEGEGETAWGPVEGYVAGRSATGSKTDTPRIETPQSISVVTRDQMDAQGARTVSEALSYSPSIKPDLYGTDTRFDWISIRGFDSYIPGFFRDGLLARNNNAFAVWRMEPYGLERIEVLRGPASVLYGQINSGGLVNVVSKRPTAEPLQEVEFGLGSDNHREGRFDLGGALDQDRTLLYRLTGLGRNSDTQIDFVEDDRLFVAPALTWRPNDDTTLTLLSHYQVENTGSTINFLPPQGTLLPNPNGQIPTNRFTGEQSFDGFDKSEWAIGYWLEHQLNDIVSLRQNTRYGEIDLDYKTVFGTGLDPTDPSQRTLSRGAFASREKVDAFAIDNQIETQLTTGALAHTLLFGLDYQHHVFDEKSAIGAAPPLDLFDPIYGQPVAEPPPFVDSEFTLEQAGFYLQDQMKLFDRWVFVLGGRYDRASIATDDRLVGTSTEQKDDAFTGRAGLVYLSEIGLAPYLSYSESFFPVVGTDTITGEPFEPETGRQYEAGVKYQPPGQNSFVTFAAFDIRRQNYLTSDPDFIERQTGEIRSRGLEVEAVASLAEGINLSAAYTWLADFDILESSDPSEVGKREPIVPEHFASLWVDYHPPEGAFAGFGFGAGVRYIGSTFGDSANTAALKVPSYTLFDAMVDYEIDDHWRLAVNARNLTDETYLSCWDTCFYGSGRSLIASLRYRW